MSDHYTDAATRLLNRFRKPAKLPSQVEAGAAPLPSQAIAHVTINRPAGCVIVLGGSVDTLLTPKASDQ